MVVHDYQVTFSKTKKKNTEKINFKETTRKIIQTYNPVEYRMDSGSYADKIG